MRVARLVLLALCVLACGGLHGAAAQDDDDDVVDDGGESAQYSAAGSGVATPHNESEEGWGPGGKAAGSSVGKPGHDSGPYPEDEEENAEEKPTPPRISAKQTFAGLDLNKDGRVTHAEVVERLNEVFRAEVQQAAMSEQAAAETAKEEAALRPPEDPAAGGRAPDVPPYLAPSEEHMEAMQEEFRAFDTDDSKTLEWQELKKHILGEVSSEAGSEEEQEENMWWHERVSKVERLRFDTVDADSSGALSEYEYSEFLDKILPEVDRLMDQELTSHQAHVHIHHGDQDKDGGLSLEEFGGEAHEALLELTHPAHIIDFMPLLAHQDLR